MSRARLTAWRDARREPLAFTLDGVRYEVGEQPARTWVLAILADEPADLLLDLLPEHIAEQLWDDACDPDTDTDPELLHRIGQALLARATGRPWWQATALVATLVDQWDLFDALAADRGIGNLLDWPIDRLVNWTYHRLTKDAKAEDRRRIDAELAAPPVTADPDAPDGWADEESGWLAVAAQVGVVGG